VSNQGNDQGKTDGARLRVDEAKAEDAIVLLADESRPYRIEQP
jgi:hypothetical protein